MNRESRRARREAEQERRVILAVGDILKRQEELPSGVDIWRETRMWSGGLHPAIYRLEDKGLIDSAPEEHGPGSTQARRSLWFLTEAGISLYDHLVVSRGQDQGWPR